MLKFVLSFDNKNAASVSRNLETSVFKARVPIVNKSQFFIKMLKFLIFPSPRKGSSVVRVRMSLHSGFVSVINNRHSGHCILKHGRKHQPFFRKIIVNVCQSEVRTVFFRHIFRSAQKRYGSLSVMTSEHIHRAVKNFFGIIFRYAHYISAKITRRNTHTKKVHDRGPERIIHNRIQLFTEKILSHQAVAHLV